MKEEELNKIGYQEDQEEVKEILEEIEMKRN